MEDDMSQDSTSTADEFYVVQAEPKLPVSGNGNPLEVANRMSEILAEESLQVTGSSKENPFAKADDDEADQPSASGASQLTGTGVAGPLAPLLDPDQDSAVQSSAEAQKKHRVFHFPGVVYLGTAGVSSPKDADEINRNLRELDGQAKAELRITLAIPDSSTGAIKLLDQGTGCEIATFDLPRIAFCTRGVPVSRTGGTGASGIGSNFSITSRRVRAGSGAECAMPSQDGGQGECGGVGGTGGGDGAAVAPGGNNAGSLSRCFAFTYYYAAPGARTHGELLFQCHAFRCKSDDELNRVMNRLVQAFYSSPTLGAQPMPFNMANIDTLVVGMRLTLDIREEDAKGTYNPVPREKGNSFKLRANVDKKVIFSVHQTCGDTQLKIERCLGLFIGSGRFLENSDMTLLELESMGGSAVPGPASNVGEQQQLQQGGYTVSGCWVPNEHGLDLLNKETAREQRVFMTVGAHLLIANIDLPVSLRMVCKAKIFHENEHFWIFNKRPLVEDCQLYLEEESDNEGNVLAEQYRVVQVEYLSDRDLHHRTSTSGTGTAAAAGSAPPATPTDSEPPDLDEDDDEPLMSGSGLVSKEVTDAQLMETWSDVLLRWQADLTLPRPRQVNELVRRGVPEALRGEVWQLLAGCYVGEAELHDAYRILITKECKYDAVIRRDMCRTFPAHDFFRDSEGQESLFRVSKAYAIYDDEIGYCQGFSFIAAAFLLHMPEEQAFALLVKIMSDYGVRNLFRQNFEGLCIRLYQLERLIEDHISELGQHFVQLNLEAHMYASQWFLTLFTAKFPLHAVFHILDLFLSERMEVVFKIALALLKLAKKDLLGLDFEGVLKYFRVTLPKRYRMQEACLDLITTATKFKVNAGKLTKYEKEWTAARRRQAETEDPVDVLERDLRIAQDEFNRLERENDVLAEELVSSKIDMQHIIDQLEDKTHTMLRELFSTRKELTEAVEDRERLNNEVRQIKGMLRLEVDQKDERLTQQEKIIAEYKRITSDLSRRAEAAESAAQEQRELQQTNRELATVREIIAACSTCSEKLGEAGVPPQVLVDEQCLQMDTLTKQVQELELELANTKLAHVESRCELQSVTHQLTQLQLQQQQQQAGTNKTWLGKTLTSLREKAAGIGGGSNPGGVAVAAGAWRRESSSAPAGGVLDPLHTQPPQSPTGQLYGMLRFGSVSMEQLQETAALPIIPPASVEDDGESVVSSRSPPMTSSMHY